MPTDPGFNKRIQKSAEDGEAFGQKTYDDAARDGAARQQESAGKGSAPGGPQGPQRDATKPTQNALEVLFGERQTK